VRFWSISDEEENGEQKIGASDWDATLDGAGDHERGKLQ